MNSQNKEAFDIFWFSFLSFYPRSLSIFYIRSRS